ncbi:MAG: prolyl oligopeptidase family serine peptidase [Verrucomicrobiaceae bacterium]
MTDAIYAEIAQDAEFRNCGSALTTIYDEVTFTEFRDGHYFHYIPPKLDRTKPAPALVFLHGSGGNFKAYVWLLSKMADQTGCTVIAPTFGLGNWEKRGAYDAITAAIRDAGKHAAIDPAQIHLMGLSNGGKGVCLAESADGPRFHSLIFLSSVFHNRITPEQLAEKFTKRPVLVISGGNDDRVPWDYVSGYAAKLKNGGCDVTTRVFPDDDHFLFFRKRDEVLRIVAEWLKSS